MPPRRTLKGARNGTKERPRQNPVAVRTLEQRLQMAMGEGGMDFTDLFYGPDDLQAFQAMGSRTMTVVFDKNPRIFSKWQSITAHIAERSMLEHRPKRGEHLCPSLCLCGQNLWKSQYYVYLPAQFFS